MLHVASPSLLGREAEYVLDAVTRCELSWRGPYVEQFEKDFAKFCKVDHAIACSSGTAALHLALAALNIREYDQVILPVLSYVAVANAVRYVGATPIFCDVLPNTWCLDPDAVDDLLRKNERVTAILPVHLYGIPCDMTSLLESAMGYGTNLVEDAAEAHGATHEGNPTGSLGDIAAFSFFANKIITTGEGGMVTTSDDKLAERVRLLRGQGQPPGRQFFHSVIGFNYRMTNLQAAFGVAQLERFDETWTYRRKIFKTYQAALSCEPGFEFPAYSEETTPWMFSLLVPKDVSRNDVASKLADAGIETRPVFPKITDFPPYRDYPGKFPHASDIAARGISLPTHAGLTLEEVTLVADELKRVVCES